MNFRKAFALCLGTLAAAIEPDTITSPVAWAQANIVIPDGEREGQKWDPTLTPYAVEILECLAIDSPHTRVSVKKSAQTGLTTLGMVWLGCMIDTAPARMMIVEPTVPVARDLNSEKLDPLIRASKPLRRKVRAQTLKSAIGSTSLRKKFARGSLILTGANSSADLRMKTIRFVLADEIDEWPLNLEKQGDPMGMVDARQIAFTRSRTHKKLEISTPILKGFSRIDAAYEAGDQRKWMMPCPHCRAEITFEFARFHCNEVPPYQPHYIPPCCGAVIEPWQQRDMVLAGRWVATKPGPGRHPSFHVWAAMSLLTDWETLALKYRESAGDEEKEKTFVNTWLGESYEDKGSDIDIEAVITNTTDRPAGIVPINAALLAGAADVQGDRIEWAVWAYGPSPGSVVIRSYLIATGVIAKDPQSEEAWSDLSTVIERKWEFAGGPQHRADRWGVDTGYLTSKVYAFTRANAHVLGLDGRDQRLKMPLGTPRRVPVKSQFGRILYKATIHPVGTYDLKFWLNRSLKATAHEPDSIDALDLPRSLVDAAYVRQLASEVLVTTERKSGIVTRQWQKRYGQANEALDIAVYCRALALGVRPLGLGADRLTLPEWTRLIAERHAIDPSQADLFALRVPPALPAEEASPPVPVQYAAPPTSKAPSVSLADIARMATRSR